MSTYHTLVTNVGAAKLANATALGQTLAITHMAVGDGNGATPTPNPAQTALVNEVRRAPLNQLAVDELNASAILAEQVIPEAAGGWWIRELGLYDEDGDLIAIGNCPPTYKPLLAEGSGRTQVIRMLVVVSNVAAVTLKIDPSIVLATRQYVDTQVLAVGNALQAHQQAADPHTQYAKKTEVEQSQAEFAAVSQFLPYNPERVYRTGETCTTLVDGELRIWEMYAGPDMTCTGKDPSDPANRHDGWVLDSAPFWWIPYGNVVGRPSWWLAETPPERAVMEMGQDLPVAVYWRLARQYPALVTGAVINTGDIRGEFLRVWDNGRGVDPGRALGSAQLDQMQRITGSMGAQNFATNQAATFTGEGAISVSSGSMNIATLSGSTNRFASISFDSADSPDARVSATTSGETRPRNAARAMIIEI